MAAKTEVISVPDIGEYKNVDVIEIFVKVGDVIKEEASIISLETDKATMEVPSPKAGKVMKLLVKVGDKVSQGTPMFELEAGASADAAPAVSASVAPAVPVSPVAAPSLTPPAVASVSAGGGANLVFVPDNAPSEGIAGGYASPAVRRLASSFGLEILNIPGTGRKGRVTQEDIENFVKNKLAGAGAGNNNSGVGLNLLADPVIDFAKFGEIEKVDLSRIKKISGANLHRNWVKIPHITFFEDADISILEEFRAAKKAEAEKKGIKITPLAFIVKAVAKALEAFPEMNASLSPTGDQLILKKYIHVGVAVDTPVGLMVPVIKDANKKGIYEIAKELNVLSAKARDGKLVAADMQGGCFTISSLGNIGTQYFAPIVNMPEVGILGVSKSQMKPIWNPALKNFEPKLMLPLSLSVDHRVIDGAYAGKFIVMVAGCLSDLKEIIL